MKLKDYLNKVSKSDLLQLKKCQIRECDEEVKNSFVAFVDQDIHSFDVGIKLKPNGDIENATCDCNDGHLDCIHKLALAQFLLSPKKNLATEKIIKKPKIAKKSDLYNLIESLDKDQLFQWLEATLLKNQTLALQFNLHFKTSSNLDPVVIEKLTEEATKSLAGKRDVLDTKKMKEMIELWKSIQQPFFEKIYQQPNLSSNIKEYNLFLIFLHKLAGKYYFEGSRFDGYLRLREKELAQHLAQQIEVRSGIEALLHNLTGDKNGSIYITLLSVIKNYLSFLEPLRKDQALEMIFNFYEDFYNNHNYMHDDFTEILLNNTYENPLREKYFHRLKCIKYNNEFNIDLLNTLVQKGQDSLLEKMAWDQINKNIYQEYNIPYYHILKDLYKKNNNTAKMIKISSALLTQTFDIDDYETILAANTTPEWQKEFRRSTLGHAASLARHNNILAQRLAIYIVGKDKDYKKIFKYLTRKTPVIFLKDYWNDMIRTQPKDLLASLNENFRNYDYEIGQDIIEIDKSCFKEMYDALKVSFQPEILKSVLRQKDYYWDPVSKDSFTYYLREQLGVL